MRDANDVRLPTHPFDAAVLVVVDADDVDDIAIIGRRTESRAWGKASSTCIDID